jgi:hypothetical protein
MKPVEDQIERVREVLIELQNTLPNWDNDRRSKSGAARYRSIGKRVVESARMLEALIKENTFPNL